MDFVKNEEKLFTLREFAERIHYSERSVRQMCIEGKIKAQKIGTGRKWLIAESEINSCLMKRKRNSLVTNNGIYGYEKIMNIPQWAKN